MQFNKKACTTNKSVNIMPLATQIHIFFLLHWRLSKMAIYTENQFRIEDLTIKQVENTIREHHVDPQEFFEIYGIKPLYKGSLVLNWLGY